VADAVRPPPNFYLSPLNYGSYGHAGKGVGSGRVPGQIGVWLRPGLHQQAVPALGIAADLGGQEAEAEACQPQQVMGIAD